MSTAAELPTERVRNLGRDMAPADRFPHDGDARRGKEARRRSRSDLAGYMRLGRGRHAAPPSGGDACLGPAGLGIGAAAASPRLQMAAPPPAPSAHIVLEIAGTDRGPIAATGGGRRLDFPRPAGSRFGHADRPCTPGVRA